MTCSNLFDDRDSLEPTLLDLFKLPFELFGKVVAENLFIDNVRRQRGSFSIQNGVLPAGIPDLQLKYKVFPRAGPEVIHAIRRRGRRGSRPGVETAPNQAAGAWNRDRRLPRQGREDAGILGVRPPTSFEQSEASSQSLVLEPSRLSVSSRSIQPSLLLFPTRQLPADLGDPIPQVLFFLEDIRNS